MRIHDARAYLVDEPIPGTTGHLLERDYVEDSEIMGRPVVQIHFGFYKGCYDVAELEEKLRQDPFLKYDVGTHHHLLFCPSCQKEAPIAGAIYALTAADQFQRMRLFLANLVECLNFSGSKLEKMGVTMHNPEQNSATLNNFDILSSQQRGLDMHNNTGQYPRTNGHRSAVWIVLAIVGMIIAMQSLGGISNAAAQSMTTPPPVPLRPGDDPAYDWERPGRPQATDSGDWTYAIKPRFASSRTLQQTTSWLIWALVSYGRVQQTPDSFQISDVKFPGCSMQWDEKRFMDEGMYMNETIYSINLGELDLTYGIVQAYGSSLKISSVGRNGVRKLEKFWEKDGSRMKSRAADGSSTDNTASFLLQDKDDISRRVAWAMVHAATLCGSKSSK